MACNAVEFLKNSNAIPALAFGFKAGYILDILSVLILKVVKDVYFPSQTSADQSHTIN